MFEPALIDWSLQGYEREIDVEEFDEGIVPRVEPIESIEDVVMYEPNGVEVSVQDGECYPDSDYSLHDDPEADNEEVDSGSGCGIMCAEYLDDMMVYEEALSKDSVEGGLDFEAEPDSSSDKDKACIGQGAAVAFSSSHPVVTDRIIFTLPEVFVGIHYVGATYFLAQLPNNFGMWVGLTGAKFLGSDIVNLGLTKNYVKSTDLGRLESALINLQVTNFGTVSHTIAQFQQECDKWSIDTDRVKQLFSGCSVEEIVENLKADDSEFASQILQTFSHVSPTALKLIFNIMREAQLNQYSNNDAFYADYSLFKNFYDDTDGSDFKEGIRSMVIDKKQNRIGFLRHCRRLTTGN